MTGDSLDVILYAAAQLRRPAVGKAAHALGWPSPGQKGTGRTRWKRPTRNCYCGDAEDEDWLILEALGLATKGDGPIGEDRRTVYWHVTPRGKQVIYVWLRSFGALELTK